MDNPSTIKMNKEKCDELSHRLKTNSLTEEDRIFLARVVRAMLWLSIRLEAGRLGLRRLKKILFGDKSEKRTRIFNGKGRGTGGTPTPNEASNGETTKNSTSEPTPVNPTNETTKNSGALEGNKGNSEGSGSQSSKTDDDKSPNPKKGHGKRPTSDYPGAERIFCAHENLKAGQVCPACQRGSVHASIENGLFIRFVGNPPITATVYETEKFRCSTCGKVFEAPLPKDVVAQRWDESAKTIAALSRYGYGLPHFRLEKMQTDLGVPVADSVLFEHGNEIADCGHKVYGELVRQAASGQCLNSDDTTCRILELIQENKTLDPDKDRVGIFTTAMVSRVEDGREIALFFSGRKHAGENMAALLEKRPTELPAPIVMVDGSSSAKKISKTFEVLLANCLTHGRRQFVDLVDNFPTEIDHVITEIGKIYYHDAVAQKEGMTADERLLYHQEQSGPVIENLKAWCRDQIESKKTEPNSGLGKAIHYLEKRWAELTLFLRVAGAPISNDIVERLIKRCVLHRKNSLFYKTQHGAVIGDILMTLIQTAVRSEKNPFHYLTALQLHRSQAHKNPVAWLPWTYEATLDAIKIKT